MAVQVQNKWPIEFHNFVSSCMHPISFSLDMIVFSVYAYAYVFVCVSVSLYICIVIIHFQLCLFMS